MLVPGETAGGEWPLIKVLNFVGVGPGAASAPQDFASPEELAQGQKDFRSQVYSLGQIIWFLLHGISAARGRAAVQDAVEMPEPLRRLLGPMLAANPEQRPLDPVALQQQIQGCLDQIERRNSGPRSSPLPLVETAALEEMAEPKRRPNRLMPLALAALLLALATLASVVLANRSRQQPVVGIPVGLPAPESSIAPLQPSVEIATAGSEPPVLYSTAVAPNEETEEPSAQAAASDENANVAANDAASLPTPGPESIAPESEPAATENSTPVTIVEEPVAPAEGPAEDVRASVETTSATENASSNPTPEPAARVPEKPNLPEFAPSPSPRPPKREERRRVRRPIKDPFKLPVLRALPPD